MVITNYTQSHTFDKHSVENTITHMALELDIEQ